MHSTSSVEEHAVFAEIFDSIAQNTTLSAQPPTYYRRGGHVQELRDRQAMAEKAALEAKRARVLEDMKRRQQRLHRLQEEEG